MKRQPSQQQARPHPAKMDDWTESRLEQSLAHLKDLHIKIRELRTALPRLVEPLADPQSSPPESLLADFQQAAIAIAKEISSLREAINNPQTKAIVAHADQSRARSPAGVRQWRPRDEPDWFQNSY